MCQLRDKTPVSRKEDEAVVICSQRFLFGGKYAIKLDCKLEVGHEGACAHWALGKKAHAIWSDGKERKGDPSVKGGAWRRATAIPTTVRGRKFPSKIQAATFDWLAEMAEIDKSRVETIIMHEIPIELPALDVNDKPVQKWRVDFMVLRRNLTETSWHIRLYESKGGKSAESADFRIKLRAYYRTYPWPVSICRQSGKNIKTVDGMSLIGKSAR